MNKPRRTSADAYKLLRNIAKIDGIRCNRPNGAFYVFADISSFGLSSVEFCNRLLDEQKVVCIPGSVWCSRCPMLHVNRFVLRLKLRHPLLLDTLFTR